MCQVSCKLDWQFEKEVCIQNKNEKGIFIIELNNINSKEQGPSPSSSFYLFLSLFHTFSFSSFFSLSHTILSLLFPEELRT